LPENQVRQMLKETIENTGRHKAKESRNYFLLKGLIGLAAGALTMLLCMLGFGIPLIALFVLAGLSVALTIILGFDSYINAIKNLFQTKPIINMDTLFLISSIAAIGISVLSFFFPLLPMMFDAPLLLFGFSYIGKALEASATLKMMSGFTFRERAPKTVMRLIGNITESTSIYDVDEGDIILVSPGQFIPVNGECEDDKSKFYNTIDKGETVAIETKKGLKLLAGMKVAGNTPLKMKVTASIYESYLVKKDDDFFNVKKAQAKEPAQSFIDKWLKYFILGLVVLAIITSITLSVFFTIGAISLGSLWLAMGCPCTLGIAISAPTTAGLKNAKKHSIEFESGEKLRTLARADILALDLNGTLTTGAPPSVTKFVKLKNTMADPLSKNDMLDLAYAIETHSQHAIAIAIKEYADQYNALLGRQRKIIQLADNGIDNSIHGGIKATIDNDHYILGNKSMLMACGIDDKLISNVNPKKDAEHIIFIVKNQIPIGYLELKRPLRNDALPLIKRFKQKKGNRVILLTGSQSETANVYGMQMGIPPSDIFANCTAIEKSDHIRQFQREGHIVVFCGDGGNDSDAVTQSDLGIAIKSDAGDVMTQECAHMTFETNALSPIMTALDISSQTVSKVAQNIGIAIAPNILLLTLSFTLFFTIGFIMPAAAAVITAGMVLSLGVILLNTYVFNSPVSAKAIASDQSTRTSKDNTAFPSLNFLPRPKQPEPKTMPAPGGKVAASRLGIFSGSCEDLEGLERKAVVRPRRWSVR